MEWWALIGLGVVVAFASGYGIYRTGYRDGYADYAEGDRKRFTGQSWKRRSHPSEW